MSAAQPGLFQTSLNVQGGTDYFVGGLKFMTVNSDGTITLFPSGSDPDLTLKKLALIDTGGYGLEFVDSDHGLHASLTEGLASPTLRRMVVEIGPVIDGVPASEHSVICDDGAGETLTVTQHKEAGKAYIVITTTEGGVPVKLGLGLAGEPTEVIDLDGNVNVTGAYKVAGTQVIGPDALALSGTAPTITLTDTTPLAKSFVLTVDGDLVTLQEPSGAVFLTLNLTTSEVQIGGVANYILLADGVIDMKGTAVLKQAGVQVVGAQQPAITPPAGGATQDAEARTAIGTIITTLQTHGLTL